MEPDLQWMRAFVAAAQELHFGRAAARLFLTQQALSKRIRRLETALATPLFARSTRRVELTAAGRRFLPLAREALAAYDAAVATMRATAEPLRVDVYAERFTPLQLLREIVERVPGLRVEPSMRQGLAGALPSVQSRELDAAFGRVHDLGRGWPAELRHRPVHLVPMDAFVFDTHPLAGRRVLSIADLREAGVAMPDPTGSPEWRGYLTRLSDELGVPVRFNEPAVGVRHITEQIRREDRAVALGERGTDLPSEPRMRQIPLADPTPMHLWSIAWHREDRNPALARLLQELPGPPRPADLGPGTWLPEIDRTALEAPHEV
ncbi:LysR family transcriptional regulator [Actinomadura viridis]|uniref:DNA-binding transcriptional LysR family regulator n=1 Tax=Actinomadura viridis TaxID=58110 RepID=A0A931DMN9_9ACTN|nr:LysR family transcriptional regulator [Actinomadura viridis]MBG6090777.1 DNA-binding transcriptional LysR family regulator [Actinomadura viridis]